LFDASWMFYVVVALILAVAAVTLFVAKRRSWI